MYVENLTLIDWKSALACKKVVIFSLRGYGINFSYVLTRGSNRDNSKPISI